MRGIPSTSRDGALIRAARIAALAAALTLPAPAVAAAPCQVGSAWLLVEVRGAERHHWAHLLSGREWSEPISLRIAWGLGVAGARTTSLRVLADGGPSRGECKDEPRSACEVASIRLLPPRELGPASWIWTGLVQMTADVVAETRDHFTLSTAEFWTAGPSGEVRTSLVDTPTVYPTQASSLDDVVRRGFSLACPS